MQIQMNMYLRFFNSDMIEVKIKLIKDVINVDIPSAIIILPEDIRLHFVFLRSFCVNLIQKHGSLIKHACKMASGNNGKPSQTICIQMDI